MSRTEKWIEMSSFARGPTDQILSSSSNRASVYMQVSTYVCTVFSKKEKSPHLRLGRWSPFGWTEFEKNKSRCWAEDLHLKGPYQNIFLCPCAYFTTSIGMALFVQAEKNSRTNFDSCRTIRSCSVELKSAGRVGVLAGRTVSAGSYCAGWKKWTGAVERRRRGFRPAVRLDWSCRTASSQTSPACRFPASRTGALITLLLAVRNSLSQIVQKCKADLLFFFCLPLKLKAKP